MLEYPATSTLPQDVSKNLIPRPWSSDYSRTWWLWFLLGSLAALTCSLIWPAAHLGNEYLPVGNDSFYHARRILDTAADPSAFYQFDPRIHAPEGSLLTWPWGYDYALGWIVRIGLEIGIAKDPMAILVWIPTVSVFLAMGLIVLLSRRLSLSLWPTALAGLCVALSPLTQYLYGVGFVDHHFAEHLLVLSLLVAGMGWLAEPQATGRAIALAAILGCAPAIHNGLFILQLPFLAVLFTWWVQGKQLPMPQTRFFCTSLLIASLLILIPSLPFREGRFEYYTLSSFHLYIAFCTAAISFFFSIAKFNARNMIVLAAGSVLLLTPIAGQVVLGQAFLVGSIERLDAIAEMKSLAEMYQSYGPLDISNRYSLLVWLIPATLVVCVMGVWRDRDSFRALFWVSALSGLILLSMQFRLHYFGSFALFFPWLILADRFARHRKSQEKIIMLITTLLILGAFSFPMRNQLLGPMIKANDLYFVNLRPLLKTLHDACEKEPGIVLSDNDAGHYIRYYTDCSVIANNFLITPQHEEKIREFEHLMSLPASELADTAPLVRYVLVRPVDITINENGSYTYVSFSPESSRLVGDLLLQPYASTPIEPPDSFELLGEARLADSANVPYARLYKLRPAALAEGGHADATSLSGGGN